MSVRPNLTEIKSSGGRADHPSVASDVAKLQRKARRYDVKLDNTHKWRVALSLEQRESKSYERRDHGASA
jgi:hypothetical protein